jgi:hypothetical protein
VTQLILREDNIGTSEVFLPLKEDPILGYGPENKNKIKNPMQTFASLKSDLYGFNDCTAFVCVYLLSPLPPQTFIPRNRDPHYTVYGTR